MSRPAPDRTLHTIEQLRVDITRARDEDRVPPQVHEAVIRVLDLYVAVSDQARRDDSSLQSWALNFDLTNFTLPNESGSRTLLPGLTAAIHHLALAFADDEAEQ